MSGPPGPRDGLTPQQVAAARADVNPRAKQRIKHKIKAEQDKKKGGKR